MCAHCLVLCRLFDMVDDENLDRAFGGLQFQPELLLYGSEYRRSGSVGRRWCRWAASPQIRIFRSHKHPALALVGCPIEREIVNSFETGFIENGAAKLLGQGVSQERNGRTAALKMTRAHHHSASSQCLRDSASSQRLRAWWLGRLRRGRRVRSGRRLLGHLKLGSILGYHQRIDRKLLRLMAHGQLESIGEQRLYHQPKLLLLVLALFFAQLRGVAGKALRLRLNIVFFGAEPARSSRDLKIPHVIRKSDQHL